MHLVALWPFWSIAYNRTNCIKIRRYWNKYIKNQQYYDTDKLFLFWFKMALIKGLYKTISIAYILTIGIYNWVN